ncbi:HNH endonuclease signature motif containing protein [uncultured Paracoccus sp.]|uniref:HNH endonuclease n=1 Tax=uncultured Paracoccus sp. TaxID=189685 RepID=UPI0030D77AEC
MARTPMPKAGQILHLTRWQKARQACAMRASFRCQKCGVLCFLTGPRTGEADHKISRRQLIETGGDVFALDNLQWLCQPCHARKSVLEGHEARQTQHPATPPKTPRSERLKARSRVKGRKAFLMAAGLAPDDIIR